MVRTGWSGVLANEFDQGLAVLKQTSSCLEHVGRCIGAEWNRRSGWLLRNPDFSAAGEDKLWSGCGSCGYSKEVRIVGKSKL